jgi:hypothetical protein
MNVARRLAFETKVYPGGLVFLGGYRIGLDSGYIIPGLSTRFVLRPNGHDHKNRFVGANSLSLTSFD